jgi:hypothetical protein
MDFSRGQSWPTPTYTRIREMVLAVLDAQDNRTGLGENWHYNFIKRHYGQIKIGSQRVIDAERVDSCNSLDISQFFDRYEALIKQHKVSPDNIWNMDESGLQSYENGS